MATTPAEPFRRPLKKGEPARPKKKTTSAKNIANLPQPAGHGPFGTWGDSWAECFEYDKNGVSSCCIPKTPFYGLRNAHLYAGLIPDRRL
jgi:hypothetical protein